MQRVAKHLYRRGNSYTYRRVIPPYARDAFQGKCEYVRSLGDITQARAMQLRAVHQEYCDRLITSAKAHSMPAARVDDLLRVKHVPDQAEIEHAVRTWLLEREAESRMHIECKPEVDAEIADLRRMGDEVVRVMRSRRSETPLMTRWIVDALIATNDWSVPATGSLRRLIEDRVARGQQEFVARIGAELAWESQPPPTHRMFAPEEFATDRISPPPTPQRSSAPLWEVFDGYRAEQEPKPATIKAWKSALTSLIAHLGHEDATRVRPEDIVAWKNALLAPRADGEKARSQYTVRHKYLGAVKPVFSWAVANKLIDTNPVVGIKVAVPRRTRTRPERGYTTAEAKIVLEAALAVDWQSAGTYLAFARRWLPWLCAYTGARGAELAQLRSEDVGKTDDGIWFVRITPEAGSQKGNFARLVALHPHLVEQGFVAAAATKVGPLFYDPIRRREGADGNPQYKKVAQRVADWVRSLGVTDPELQPNHGWRHRFITVARDIGMDADVRRAFTAHAAKDEHQSYGETLVRTGYRWMERFPRFEV